MAKIKTAQFRQKIGNKPGMDVTVNLTISVNTKGEFYFKLPELLEPIYKGASKPDSCYVRTNTVFSKSLEMLESGVYSALRTIANEQVVIKVEHVICYNIKSDVSFALDAEGSVQPNAGYPGAYWPKDDERYGSHYASRPCVGGYSLVVGAMAYEKTTKIFAGQEDVTYTRWHGKNGSHLGNKNPAERLNSWTSFTLPEKCREIPYSDEAAEFFFNLMHGMAQLSRLIQENTFCQQKLLETIAQSTGSNLLGFSNQKQ